MTAGGPFPGVAGFGDRDRPSSDDDLLRVPGRFALTIVRGEHRTQLGPEALEIEDLVDVSPVREHSAISDFSIEVSGNRDLEDWGRAIAWLTFDERVEFVGRLEVIETDDRGWSTTLKGRDSGAFLDENSYDFGVESTEGWRAIEQCWNAVAPQWDVDVVPSANPQPVGEFNSDGSPKEILQEIHDEFNFKFVIDRRRLRRATAFPARRLVRPGAWETINLKTKRDVTGYYNAARVIGAARPDGTRYGDVFIDEDEVDRIMADEGIPREDAIALTDERDISLDSNEQCLRRAESIVEEAIQNDERSATIDTTATMLDPGYAYTIDELDDLRAVGPYSAQFDGNDAHIEIGNDVFSRRTRSGALTMWARAQWSTLADADVRMIGSAPIRTTNSEYAQLRFETNAGGAAVRSFDAGPEDGVWHLHHWDWDYDPASNTTSVRGGHDGEIVDTLTFDGEINASGSQPVYLGRWGTDYYPGYLEDVRLFDRPLEAGGYELLADGQDSPGRPLQHRWRLHEGPNRADQTVHDVVGGAHGERIGVESAGSPQTLERTDFGISRGSHDGTLNFDEPHSVRRSIKALERDQRRTKRGA